MFKINIQYYYRFHFFMQGFKRIRLFFKRLLGLKTIDFVLCIRFFNVRKTKIVLQRLIFFEIQTLCCPSLQIRFHRSTFKSKDSTFKRRCKLNFFELHIFIGVLMFTKFQKNGVTTGSSWFSNFFLSLPTFFIILRNQHGSASHILLFLKAINCVTSAGILIAQKCKTLFKMILSLFWTSCFWTTTDLIFSWRFQCKAYKLCRSLRKKCHSCCPLQRDHDGVEIRQSAIRWHNSIKKPIFPEV